MPTMTRATRNKYMGYLFVDAYRSMEAGNITREQLGQYLVELDNMPPRELFSEYCQQMQANEIINERRARFCTTATGAHV